MTSPSSEPRQNAPPYASLRAMGEAATGTTASGAGKPAPDPGYWRQEADKVDVLLQTLWTGFLEAEGNGLPTALADYVTAYTGAMRLKLTLMGYSAVPQRSFKTQLATRSKAP